MTSTKLTYTDHDGARREVQGCDQIKPGCLVQSVDTGHFHHIVRLFTAESGEIYIQTTISDSITHAPDDLIYIG
jgi:hypothetical protein